jgi:hypothetical protein
MKIAVNYIKRKLVEKHDWGNLEENKYLVDALLKDTLSIIDDKLRELKKYINKKIKP